MHKVLIAEPPTTAVKLNLHTQTSPWYPTLKFSLPVTLPICTTFAAQPTRFMLLSTRPLVSLVPFPVPCPPPRDASLRRSWSAGTTTTSSDPASSVTPALQHRPIRIFPQFLHFADEVEESATRVTVPLFPYARAFRVQEILVIFLCPKTQNQRADLYSPRKQSARGKKIIRHRKSIKRLGTTPM